MTLFIRHDQPSPKSDKSGDWERFDSGTHSPDSKKSGFSLASITESTKSQDINVRAAMVHVIGDLLQVMNLYTFGFYIKNLIDLE